jgi:hypothetical protein
MCGFQIKTGEKNMTVKPLENHYDRALHELDEGLKSGLFIMSPFVRSHRSGPHDFKKFDSIIKKAKKFGLNPNLLEAPEFPELSQASQAVYRGGYNESGFRAGYSFPFPRALSTEEVQVQKSDVDFFAEYEGRKVIIFKSPFAWLKIFDDSLITAIMNGDKAYYRNDGVWPRMYTEHERSDLIDDYRKIIEYSKKVDQFVALSQQVKELEEQAKTAKLEAKKI